MSSKYQELFTSNADKLSFVIEQLSHDVTAGRVAGLLLWEPSDSDKDWYRDAMAILQAALTKDGPQPSVVIAAIAHFLNDPDFERLQELFGLEDAGSELTEQESEQTGQLYARLRETHGDAIVRLVQPYSIS